MRARWTASIGVRQLGTLKVWLVQGKGLTKYHAGQDLKRQLYGTVLTGLPVFERVRRSSPKG